MTKVTDDERLIEKSGYFREKWYLRNYPEAAGSGLAPARHYLQEGWKKGFRPSMQFDHEFISILIRRSTRPESAHWSIMREKAGGKDIFPTRANCTRAFGSKTAPGLRTG